MTQTKSLFAAAALTAVASALTLSAEEHHLPAEKEHLGMMSWDYFSNQHQASSTATTQDDDHHTDHTFDANFQQTQSHDAHGSHMDLMEADDLHGDDAEPYDFETFQKFMMMWERMGKDDFPEPVATESAYSYDSKNMPHMEQKNLYNIQHNNYGENTEKLGNGSHSATGGEGSKFYYGTQTVNPNYNLPNYQRHNTQTQTDAEMHTSWSNDQDMHSMHQMQSGSPHTQTQKPKYSPYSHYEPEQPKEHEMPKMPEMHDKHGYYPEKHDYYPEKHM